MLEFGRKKIQNLLPLGLRLINFEFSKNKNPENLDFQDFSFFIEASLTLKDCCLACYFL